MSVTVID